MTLFGKKNDESAEVPNTALFTPERTLGSAPSGKGKTVVIALVLIAMAGGGYFAMKTMSGPSGPVLPPQTAMTDMPAPDMASPSDAPADSMAADLSTPTDALQDDPLAAPPMPGEDVAVVDPLAVEAPADAGLESAPDATLDPMADATATDPLADTAATEAVPAVDTPVDAPVDVAADGPATDATIEETLAIDDTAMPAVDAADEAAAVPAEPVAETVVETAAETPAIEADPASTAATEPAPAVAVTGEEAQPPGDLPVPAEMAAPSAAEKAIVDNAAAVSQLSQPAPASGTMAGSPEAAANAAATQGLAEVMSSRNAIVRPTPPQYVVVKKQSDAGDIDSRLTAARIALSQNRNSGALQLFNELYQEYPMDKRVMMGRAVTLQKLGQSGEALSAYEQVLDNDPKNLEALTNMLGLLKGQNPSLATEKLAELRATYPYNADITAQLGISLGEQGNYVEAEKYLDMAEALQPSNTNILYNKAVLYDKMGKKDQAGALYRHVVRLAAEGKMDQSLPIDAIKRRLSTLR